MGDLTHFDEQGRAKMVDVGNKAPTKRVALAQGMITMKPETLERIEAGTIAKGDVLAVAQVAGIMGGKQTSSLIPMCHPLFLEGVELTFSLDKNTSSVMVAAQVRLTGKTGVEMEALTSVSIALLTIYDMCKAIDKDMLIGDIKLMEKSGGKSGLYQREEGE